MGQVAVPREQPKESLPVTVLILQAGLCLPAAVVRVVAPTPILSPRVVLLKTIVAPGVECPQNVNVGQFLSGIVPRLPSQPVV